MPATPCCGGVPAARTALTGNIPSGSGASNLLPVPAGRAARAEVVQRRSVADFAELRRHPVVAPMLAQLFLPFADDDPKTAEIVSKALLLARDHEIKDPTILEQLRS